jgi:hypothetical protein
VNRTVRRALFGLSLVVLSLGATLFPRASFACTIARPVSPTDVVRGADAIVRAQSLGYASPASIAGSQAPLRFRVIEVIRGNDVPQEFLLPGVATDRDDFNSGSVPYQSVRRTGEGGCFSRVYRTGAEFLLLMQKRGTDYTPEWYALGPVNEQLWSRDDPWLACSQGGGALASRIASSRIQPCDRTTESSLQHPRWQTRLPSG